MFVEKKDILFTNMGEGVTRRSLGHGKNMMACIMTFKKGCHVEAHSHEIHEQFIMVLEGTFELTCGEEKKIMKKGDCCYAVPNEIHSTLCLEDDSSILDMHTPLRFDILNDQNSVHEE